MSRALVVAVAVLTVGVGTPPVAAETRYFVTDLDTLGGDLSKAIGLNDRGQVVGLSTDDKDLQMAFLWENGSMQSLHWSANWTFSTGSDINNQGLVIGFAKTPPNTLGRIWNPVTHQVMTLPFLPVGQGTGCFGRGINEDNVSVGRSDDTWLVHYGSPVYWDSAGGVHALPTLGGREGNAIGINNDGVMVGNAQQPGGLYRAVAWQDGSVTAIGPEDVESSAYRINDLGIAVGYFVDENGVRHAATFDLSANVTDLARLNMGDATAFGINEGGLIVGQAEIAGGELHAFLYDGAMRDLNDLVPDNTGWVLNVARDVNVRGQIVGWGTIAGETHAFLLTPIPEPSTMLLLGTGVLGAVGLLRRRRLRG